MPVESCEIADLQSVQMTEWQDKKWQQYLQIPKLDHVPHFIHQILSKEQALDSHQNLF